MVTGEHVCGTGCDEQEKVEAEARAARRAEEAIKRLEKDFSALFQTVHRGEEAQAQMGRDTDAHASELQVRYQRLEQRVRELEGARLLHTIGAPRQLPPSAPHTHSPAHIEGDAASGAGAARERAVIGKRRFWEEEEDAKDGSSTAPMQTRGDVHAVDAAREARANSSHSSDGTSAVSASCASSGAAEVACMSAMPPCA